MSAFRSQGPLELTVTEGAQAFMKRMVRFGGRGSGAGFWLSVKSGGCSGLAATFEVRSEPTATDVVVDLPSLRLFVSDASVALLTGVTVDFTDTRTESGLVFVDPKAEECACSTGSKGVSLGLL
jgi:iron-sulfur cluster assembly protein